MLPFALLTHGTAKVVFFSLMMASIVLGVRALVLLVRPESGTGAWLSVAALVLLSACVRWGATPLQGAPLVVGLLALFVDAVQRGHWQRAYAIAGFAVAFKFTLALPFIGLLLLHRRYTGVAVIVALVVFWNVLGFLWLGGKSAFEAYQYNMTIVEGFGDINTPDPLDPISVPRTDWRYLFYGVTRGASISRVLTLLASGAVALWMARQAMRLPRAPSLETTLAFLTPLICLALLCVYHHHYDASLIAVPLLLGALLRSSQTFTRPMLLSMLPFAAMAAFLPVSVARHALLSAFGPGGLAIVNFTFPVAITLMLLGGLLHLRKAVELEPSRTR
jgi:hypothetical protein